MNVAIPKGQESKGHFSFWAVTKAAVDGDSQLESFSETARSDGRYLYEFDGESLAYITENYAAYLTGKGYQVDKISVKEAARLLAGGSNPTDPKPTATPTNDVMTCNGGLQNPTVYKIGGSNYFKLRDLGKALDFYVGWAAEQGAFIESDKPYTE